jgi:hypothetical protein
MPSRLEDVPIIDQTVAASSRLSDVHATLSHVLPALIFGGIGVALLWYVPHSVLRFRRTGSIRVSIRPAWTPFGDWEPMVSGLKAATHDREDDLEKSELRRARTVYPFLAACSLLALALLLAGYDYLRFGHGIGN